MQLTIVVQFGNDELLTPIQIADTVGRAIGHMITIVENATGSYSQPVPGDFHHHARIRDANGNTVGSWVIG